MIPALGPRFNPEHAQRVVTCSFGNLRIVRHLGRKIERALPTLTQRIVLDEKFGDPHRRPHVALTQSVDNPTADDHCLPVAEWFIGLRKRDVQNAFHLAVVVASSARHGNTPYPRDSFLFVVSARREISRQLGYLLRIYLRRGTYHC